MYNALMFTLQTSPTLQSSTDLPLPSPSGQVLRRTTAEMQATALVACRRHLGRVWQKHSTILICC
jgi:hypothetical protein